MRTRSSGWRRPFFSLANANTLHTYHNCLLQNFGVFILHDSDGHARSSSGDQPDGYYAARPHNIARRASLLANYSITPEAILVLTGSGKDRFLPAREWG